MNFEAPLKEFVRMVKSAKNVMQDRSTALTTLQQVRCNACLICTQLALSIKARLALAAALGTWMKCPLQGWTAWAYA